MEETKMRKNIEKVLEKTEDQVTKVLIKMNSGQKFLICRLNYDTVLVDITNPNRYDLIVLRTDYDYTIFNKIRSKLLNKLDNITLNRGLEIGTYIEGPITNLQCNLIFTMVDYVTKNELYENKSSDDIFNTFKIDFNYEMCVLRLNNSMYSVPLAILHQLIHKYQKGSEASVSWFGIDYEFDGNRVMIKMNKAILYEFDLPPIVEKLRISDNYVIANTTTLFSYSVFKAYDAHGKYTFDQIIGDYDHFVITDNYDKLYKVEDLIAEYYDENEQDEYKRLYIRPRSSVIDQNRITIVDVNDYHIVINLIDKHDNFIGSLTINRFAK
jgi:hypothetical protein